MPPPRNRLKQLAKNDVRERGVYPLWVDARDTPADIEAKRKRLIAAGQRRGPKSMITDRGYGFRAHGRFARAPE
jgi:hypothetical protein